MQKFIAMLVLMTMSLLLGGCSGGYLHGHILGMRVSHSPDSLVMVQNNLENLVLQFPSANGNDVPFVTNRGDDFELKLKTGQSCQLTTNHFGEDGKLTLIIKVFTPTGKYKGIARLELSTDGSCSNYGRGYGYHLSTQTWVVRSYEPAASETERPTFGTLF